MNNFIKLPVTGITCASALLLLCMSLNLLGQQQESIMILVAKKKNSDKQVTFEVGQKASYKTTKSRAYRKNRITAITDSTISFGSKSRGTVTIPFKDLTALKTIKTGKEISGTSMIVAGVAGTFLGALIIAYRGGHSVSGETGAAALIPVAGIGLLATGIVLVQPTKVDLSTIKTITKTREELVKEEALVAEQDSVQNFGRFKAGVGVGYAIASGGATSGTLLALEPAYRLNDAVAFSLRLETAAVTTSEINISGNPGASLSGSPGIKSVTANFQYYFGEGVFRPFIGAGGGPFYFGTPTTSAFGFYPRVGFDYNHFYMTLDYNILPKQSGYLDPNPCADPANLGNCGNVYYYETKYSYLGMKVGYTLGGGKR